MAAPAAGADPPPAAEATIQEIEVKGNTLLTPDEIGAALRPFIGKPVTMEELNALSQALRGLYQQKGFPAVLVVVPPQEIREGRVLLEVVQGRIGKVTVEGNRWFSEESILRYLGSLKAGEPLNQPQLQRELDLANANPDRQAAAVLLPGGAPGEMDVKLQVKDRIPLHAAAEINNTGTVSTGRLRLQATLQYTNLFDRDQVGTFQYITSPEDFDKVKVYAGSYVIPVAATGQKWTLYATQFDVNTATIADLFKFSGKGFAFGTRYSIPLPISDAIPATLFVGLDYKDQENVIDILGIPINSKVSLLPFTAGLDLLRRDDTGAFTLTNSITIHRGGLVGNSQDGAFQKIRRDAHADYIVYNGHLQRVQRFPGEFTFLANIEGQYANSVLIPTEQFAIGGYSTVRGYEERELLGDDGFYVVGELRSPNVLEPFAWAQSKQLQLQLLAFNDFGQVFVKTPLGGAFHDQLWSTGAGLRLAFSDYLLGRLDWGLPHRDGSVTQAGDSRIHYSFTLKF